MKRIRIISIVVAVIVLGGLAFAIFRDGEPRYEGRTLSVWIRTGRDAANNLRLNSALRDSGDLESDPTWQAASHAVKQIGTNAIPSLLNWFQEEDSSTKGIFSKSKWALIKWINAHPSLHIHIPSAAEHLGTATFGFLLLGKEAKPAWPVLAKMTRSTNLTVRLQALMCLVQSDADKEILKPVLLRLIHDPQPPISGMAAMEFYVRYPQDVDVAEVYKLFPQYNSHPAIRIVR